MDGAELSRLWKVCTRTAAFAQGMQLTAHSQEAAVVLWGQQLGVAAQTPTCESLQKPGSTTNGHGQTVGFKIILQSLLKSPFSGPWPLQRSPLPGLI